MEEHELEKLRTLRLQSLELIEKMRRGEEKCRALVYGGNGYGGLLNPKSKSILKSSGHNISQTLEANSSPVSVTSHQKHEDFDLKHSTSPGLSKSKRDCYKPALNTSNLSTEGITCFSPKASPPRKSPKSSPHANHNTLNLTSTPNQSLTGTPKSILKRRKIIDDNVKVESKYAYTPTANKSGHKKSGLNYSYSDVDDLGLAMKLNAQRSEGRTPHSKSFTEATDGSYIEEYLDTHPDDLEPDLKDTQKESYIGHKVKPKTKTPSDLLQDSGNKKANKNIVTNFSQRSKSVVFKSDDPDEVCVSHFNVNGSSLNLSLPFQQSPPSTDLMTSSLQPRTLPPSLDSRLQPPLLGYDWIAGALDAEDALYSMPEEYFDDIKNFRKRFKEDCLSNAYSG